jgi:hypothetical protein
VKHNRAAATEPGSTRPSASSVGEPNVNIANRFATQNLRTIADAADGSGTANGSTVRANPLKTNGETDADGADANLASHSVPEKNTLDGEADGRARSGGFLRRGRAGIARIRTMM